MDSDRFAIKVAVVVVAVLTLGLFGSMVYFGVVGVPVPDQIDKGAYAALTAMLALLAKTSTSSEAQDVNVVNEPDDALPVEEVADGRPLRAD